MGADSIRRFLWAVPFVAALHVASCQSVLGPSPVDGEWTAHESARFTLYARPGSFADQHAAALADLLEDQYAVTVQTLGLSYGGRVTGFLYASAPDANRQFERSGTAYPETEAFKSICVPPFDENLFALLAHEANHVILWQGLGRAGTSFFREGLPSAVVSEHVYVAGPTALHAWAARNMARLPAVETLMNDDHFEAMPLEVAYNASGSFLAYVITRFGPEPLKRIHGAPARDVARRFGEAYGRPLSDVESDWRAFLAR